MCARECETQAYLEGVGGEWDLHFGRNVQTRRTRQGEIAVQKLAAHRLVHKPVNQHNATDNRSELDDSEGNQTPQTYLLLICVNAETAGHLSHLCLFNTSWKDISEPYRVSFQCFSLPAGYDASPEMIKKKKTQKKYV